MYPGIHNYSEIGKLNKVLLHRIGPEVENLVPDNFERLLFDDIPYLKVAQKEHDAFPYLDSPAALPVVSQQEFCDHIDDEDFFLTYGNPVIVRADSGTKLLAIAFPLYERYMRICGRGDEIDVIKKECAEAYE